MCVVKYKCKKLILLPKELLLGYWDSKLFVFFCFFFDSVSCRPGWPGTHHAAEDDCGLRILLLLLLKGWDFTTTPIVKVRWYSLYLYVSGVRRVLAL